jgi:Rieske Fe-S protein
LDIRHSERRPIAADLEDPPVSPTPRTLPRRAVLAACGTAALAAAAACSAGGSPTEPTVASTAAKPSSPARSEAPADPTSRPDGSDPVETAEAAPAGPVLASVADVQSAGAVVVGDGANPYLLAYSGDAVVAHTAICTHQGCTIAASGMCPCHGSRYDVTTGAVLNGPALRPLAELPVTVSGGQVYPG